MAIFDAMFEFSDDQAIVADAASTNILDWTKSDLEMGAGTPLWLNVRVGTAFDGGTSLAVSLRYDTVAPIDGSSTVIYTTDAIAQASLTAGAWIIRMPLPVNVDEERILGLWYDDTGAFSAGTVNAWLDHGPQSSYDTQVTTSNI